MRLFFLYFGLLLNGFAQSTSTLMAPLSNSGTAIFPIDPMQRGFDIIKMFSTLNSGGYKTTTSEIGIQTTRNGFIPRVQKITPASYDTILLIQFLDSSGITQYVPVLVEQIVEVVYSPYKIPTSGFTATITSGVLPVFSMNLSQRALDIQNMFGTLNTTYKKALSTVSFQTSLTGPFYLSLADGLIPDVQDVSLIPSSYNTLLLVSYKVGSLTTSLVVAPEQIYGINYSP